jgi:hypothetical protein
MFDQDELVDLIPLQAIVVATEKHTYRLGEADEKGQRTIARDGKPLRFSSCVLARLCRGEPMRLFAAIGQEVYELCTTPVQAVEIGQ